MALDIREGDVFVVADVDYPIRSCAEWEWGYSRKTIKRLATKTGKTKRAPAISSGKRGTPTVNLTDLRCTPLDPVDPELRQRLTLETPHELLQSYVDGGDTFYHLIVEDLKK